jgi:aminopeptidase N/puromycin-sensitive aminopeptidase
VRPEHYSLTITPDLAKARFAGAETIEVVLEKPASAIVLNAAEIEFGAVRAWGGRGGAGGGTNAGILRSAQNDKQEQTAVVTLDVEKEQATFTFARPLPAGPVVLQIAYTGVMNDKLRGFYLSKTKLRSYGVTQFEATDARRAFPSFDEPALKATFDVTLVVDAGDTAFSNNEMVEDTPGPEPGKHMIRFATTPKMSTYLVAWLVGDFQCTKGKAEGVAIRACATPDKVELTQFAVEAAKWDLKYYDQYFGIHYPLSKLDMVAVPDFEAGAMENFGCIAFRETEMLVDEKHGTVPAKKDVAQTVAHELAHQWFGDLVTPAWWNDLWLNEGFATWMESKAAAAWQPKWNFDQDAAADLDRTMAADASPEGRAVRSRAETPAEIDEMFDDMAYGKAGAVIGMVENYLGEEVFRKAIQAYLAQHLYGNATAEDVWVTLAQVSGLPVDRMMRSFIEQRGVPLVHVDGTGAGAKVTQRLFAATGTDTEAKDWTIPLCFKGVPCRLLQPRQTTMDVPIPVSAGLRAGGMPFVFANAGDKGYYRTEYAPPELAALVANAETGLTPPERIGLLGDRWALMRAGQGSVGEFLDLVLAVKQDPNPTVMESALGRLETIETQIATDADRERLDAVVRREFGDVYGGLGGASRHEGWEHADLRELVFEALGRAKDPEVLAEAASLTSQLFSGQKVQDSMLADAAVALATPDGDTAMYDKLMRVIGNAQDPDFKEAALHVLTRFQDRALVERTLEYALSGEVRTQDSWELLALLLERRETQDQAWTYITGHWAEVERKATANAETRIAQAAGAFCTVEKRAEVKAFFAAHPVGASERTLAGTLESIDGCIALRGRQEPELRRWLETHGGR